MKFLYQYPIYVWRLGRKLYNLLQVICSFYLSIKFKKNLHYGLPFSLSIEPTTACNLRCPHCVSGLRSFQRPTGMISFQLFKKIIDESKNNLLYLTLYFQGEPMIHKKFIDMVSYAHKQNIFVATSTNAHFIDTSYAKEIVLSGLDKIIISIDGITQEIYEIYRKSGDVKKVLSGTKNILYWKKRFKKKNLM